MADDRVELTSHVVAIYHMPGDTITACCLQDDHDHLFNDFPSTVTVHRTYHSYDVCIVLVRI